jgi:hypothetical protein
MLAVSSLVCWLSLSCSVITVGRGSRRALSRWPGFWITTLAVSTQPAACRQLMAVLDVLHKAAAWAAGRDSGDVDAARRGITHARWARTSLCALRGLRGRLV